MQKTELDFRQKVSKASRSDIQDIKSAQSSKILQLKNSLLEIESSSDSNQKKNKGTIIGSFNKNKDAIIGSFGVKTAMGSRVDSSAMGS